jgi:hypothetical protein
MENILVHEFGHQIYNYMPSEYRNKVMSRKIFIIRSDLSIVKLNINYRYWVDTSAGVLIVPQGIIRPVVLKFTEVRTITFIRYEQ